MGSKNFVIDLAYRAVQEQWDIKRANQEFDDRFFAEGIMRDDILDAVQAIADQKLSEKTAGWVNHFINKLMEASDAGRDAELLFRLAQIREPETWGNVDVPEMLSELQSQRDRLGPFMDLANAVQKGLSLAEACEEISKPERIAAMHEQTLIDLIQTLPDVTRTARPLAYVLARLGEAAATRLPDQHTILFVIDFAFWVGRTGYDIDPQFVLQRLEYALEWCQQKKETAGESEALLLIGNIQRFQGHFVEAQGKIERALKLFTDYGNNMMCAQALHALGEIALSQGQYEHARTNYEQALTLFQEGQEEFNRLGQANTFHALGKLCSFQGQYHQARDYFAQASEIYAECDDKTDLAHAHLSLGDTYRGLGKHDQANEYYEQALALYEITGYGRGRAHTLHSLGDLKLFLNQSALAREKLEQALDLYGKEDVQDLVGQANVLVSLGDACCAEGHLQQAQDCFTDALRLHISWDNIRGQVLVLLHRGDMCLKLGQYDPAMADYHQVLELCKKLGDRAGTAHALCNIGAMHLLSAHFEKAKENSQKAAELYWEIGDLGGLMSAYEIIGRAWMGQGDLQQAYGPLLNALEIFENVRSIQKREDTRRILLILVLLKEQMKLSIL